MNMPNELWLIQTLEMLKNDSADREAQHQKSKPWLSHLVLRRCAWEEQTCMLDAL